MHKYFYWSTATCLIASLTILFWPIKVHEQSTTTLAGRFVHETVAFVDDIVTLPISQSSLEQQKTAYKTKIARVTKNYRTATTLADFQDPLAPAPHLIIDYKPRFNIDFAESPTGGQSIGEQTVMGEEADGLPPSRLIGKMFTWMEHLVIDRALSRALDNALHLNYLAVIERGSSDFVVHVVDFQKETPLFHYVVAAESSSEENARAIADPLRKRFGAVIEPERSITWDQTETKAMVAIGSIASLGFMLGLISLLYWVSRRIVMEIYVLSVHFNLKGPMISSFGFIALPYLKGSVNGRDVTVRFGRDIKITVQATSTRPEVMIEPRRAFGLPKALKGPIVPTLTELEQELKIEGNIDTFRNCFADAEYRAQLVQRLNGDLRIGHELIYSERNETISGANLRLRLEGMLNLMLSLAELDARQNSKIDLAG